MSDKISKSTKTDLPVVWGPGHQIFYANAFSLRISDSEVMIELGTTQNLSNQESILSTHQMILSPKAAKILSLVLARAVQDMEGRFGEVKIDRETLQALVESLPQTAEAS